MLRALSQPETKPTWDSFLKPPNFMPLQSATLELKKLVPRRRRVNNDHAVNVLGRGLTAIERADVITETNSESLKAAMWGRMQAKQRVMSAMARVGLKVGSWNAKKFADIKDSWQADDTSDANIGRIHEICCDDHKGEEAKRWSSSLEKKGVHETRLEHRCKPKNLKCVTRVELKCATRRQRWT